MNTTLRKVLEEQLAHERERLEYAQKVQAQWVEDALKNSAEITRREELVRGLEEVLAEGKVPA